MARAQGGGDVHSFLGESDVQRCLEGQFTGFGLSGGGREAGTGGYAPFVEKEVILRG